MAPVEILIVEDDPSYALELEMMLQRMGYQFAGLATNLQEAREKIASRRPDLVISDIFLSQSNDGISLAKELLHKQIPTILITSSTGQDVYNEAKPALPTAYLVKPFDQLTLQAAIERVFILQGKPVFIAQVLHQWHRDQLVKDHIFVRRGAALLKLRVTDIDYVKADRNYCYLHSGAGRFALKCTLKSLKAVLATAPFLQVNRGTLVNFHRLDSVNFTENTITLGEVTFPIGNTYRSEITSWMNRL
ncbi:MAG: response regulator transcription factor [Bacteroidota bacterium]